ncbi:MAG: hypothetical protein MJ200_05320 [Mycoplasmoidaceae bacterium]|nr:hypothetical protein [Mycoplasmoidaceae bacterium]
MSKTYLNKSGLERLVNKIKGIIPIKVSQLQNDSGYLTQHQDISSKVDKAVIYSILGLDTDTYSSSSTYAVGDMVIYNNAIYECKIAITRGESFDINKWDLVPIIVN